MRRERAGRSGKTVTVAEPFVTDRESAQRLLAELKRSCGSGGALRNATRGRGFALEIQGDQIERVLAVLHERGFNQARQG